jgi:RsmE family RNA methyltransferase
MTTRPMEEIPPPSFPGVESGDFTGFDHWVAATKHRPGIQGPLVNIILFSPREVELPLPRRDARARHILTVLRRQPGDQFDAGLIDGPRGKATVVAVEPDALRLSFAWGEPPLPLAPLRLILGLPRPQTARDLLREGTALGIAAMDFVRTARGEPSYAQSSLWTTGEWRDLLVAGAAQAFCTRLPAVQHGDSVDAAIGAIPEGYLRLALDNYEAAPALAGVELSKSPGVVLALGAERGWSDTERSQLRRNEFQFVHLGPRVLRMETATIAAVTLVKAKRGWA